MKRLRARGEGREIHTIYIIISDAARVILKEEGFKGLYLSSFHLPCSFSRFLPSSSSFVSISLYFV